MDKDYRVVGERIKIGDNTFAEVGDNVKGGQLATDQKSVDYLVSIGKIEPSDGQGPEDPEVVKMREEADKLKERNAILEKENNDLRSKMVAGVTNKAVNDLEKENQDLKEENAKLHSLLEEATKDGDKSPPMVSTSPNSGEPPKPQPGKSDAVKKGNANGLPEQAPSEPNTGIAGTADTK